MSYHTKAIQALPPSPASISRWSTGYQISLLSLTMRYITKKLNVLNPGVVIGKCHFGNRSRAQASRYWMFVTHSNSGEITSRLQSNHPWGYWKKLEIENGKKGPSTFNVGVFSLCSFSWFHSSSHLVGTGSKKTGCWRRIVIKEDLDAEADEAGIWRAPTLGPNFPVTGKEEASSAMAEGLQMVLVFVGLSVLRFSYSPNYCWVSYSYLVFHK